MKKYDVKKWLVGFVIALAAIMMTGCEFEDETTTTSSSGIAVSEGTETVPDKDDAELDVSEPEEVVVLDTTAPKLILSRTSFEMTEGDSAPNYLDIASANDDVDGVLTSSIRVDSSDVNYDVPGTYTVTYYVSDEAGNTATQTATITVKTDVSTSQSTNVEEEVLVTRTGECYHRRKCGNGNYYPATMQEALNRDLRPCQKCY